MSSNNEKRDDAKKLEEAGFQAGESLQKIIDDAIRKGDYSSLNRQISDAINKAVDAVGEGVSNAVFGNKSKKDSGQKPAGADEGPYWQREETRTYRSSTPSAYKEASSKGSLVAEYREARDFLTGADGVASPVGNYIKEILQVAGAAISGLALLGSLAAGPGGGMWLFSIFLAFITALLAVLGFKNHKKISRIKLARKILKLMAGRDYITVDEVADAVGKGRDETRTEMRGMIQDNVFTGQAYMDKQGTTFMTSREVYQQYREMEQGREEAQKAQDRSVFKKKDLKEYGKMQEEIQDREKRESAGKAKLDRETVQILQEGRAFIEHIHQKNEEIPGEAFSEKLDRLERIVTDIFDRVAADPKSAPDLHRMMKYYLPTTQKLVDTYATLDSQNFSGQNVENAKREIERSLDTINDAFEKLLDQFFQETAWDVSSDISVMGTMMAQDGLTGGNDFSQSRSGYADPSSFGQTSPASQPSSGHGYTEGYTEGYSDSLGSGMAYAEAPDKKQK